MSNNCFSIHFYSSLNIFSKIFNDNIYIHSPELNSRNNEGEIILNIDFGNKDQDIVKKVTKYNSLCTNYFNLTNSKKYEEHINIKILSKHLIKMFGLVRAIGSGNNCSEMFCSLTLNKKRSKCFMHSISAKELTVENILICNFMNNLIFQNTKADTLKLKLIFDHNLCITHFNTLKSIRIVNKKFSVCSSCSYTVYFPPIMDEILPICNSIVSIACEFLNIFDPANWSIQILVCISSLLKVNDYYGVLKILTTMASVLNDKDSDFKCSIGYGVFPYLWEGLLDMFLLLDQGISKFLINIVKSIPVCGVIFKSDGSKRFFLEERINLSIEIQNTLSNKVRDIESNIGKSLSRKNIRKEISKNILEKTKRNILIKNNNLYNIKQNKSKHDYESSYPFKYKHDILNKVWKEKYRLFKNFTVTNSKLSPNRLEFKVIKYKDSVLIINTKFDNQNFRKGDIILIQPLNKLVNMYERQIMSFRQLAIVLEVIHMNSSLKYEESRLTLKLKIIDPGIDPSIYKHCIIIYLLNYYKYKKKITLLRRYSLKFPYPCLSTSENICREIFEKWINNQLDENNEEDNDKLVVSFSESLNSYKEQKIEIKWIVYKQEMSNFNNCLFTNKRGELLSYLLHFKNVRSDHMKKLLQLTELEKYIIWLALNSLATMIYYMNYNCRINIIIMIIFYKKAINPNAKILIIANRLEHAKIIKRTLHTLKISTQILEEEYLLFKADECTRYRKKNNFKKFPGYERWLREILVDKYDVVIVNNVELNLNFIKRNPYIEDKLNEASYDHLFIDDTDVLSRSDILLLFTLRFNSITLFSSKSADNEEVIFRGRNVL